MTRTRLLVMLLNLLSVVSWAPVPINTPQPATSLIATFAPIESPTSTLTTIVPRTATATLTALQTATAKLTRSIAPTRYPTPTPMPNACQDPEAEIPLTIPQVDLREGQVIKVTTDSDALNGDVGSVDALLANPAPDGISLREAIAAANNTPEPETIEFAPELAGAVIKVGLSNTAGLVLTGGWLIINGDINGDGNPDITLDGSLGQEGTPLSTGLVIGSSHNTVNALAFVNFPWAGIILKPCAKDPCTERVLTGNKILRNVISGSRAFGIATEQQSHGKEASNIGWKDTLIAGNVILGINEISIGLMAAFAGALGNRIINTHVVANNVSGGNVGIGVIAGDTATDWIGHPPHIRERKPVEYSDNNSIQNTIISGNIIEGITYYGISVEGGNYGNRNNVVQCTKIIGNIITRTKWRALAIFTGVESGSRDTTDNRVSDVEITHNTFEDAHIGIILGAGNKMGEFNGNNIINNQLESILLRDNIVKGYQSIGLIVWGGMTCTSTYNVLNNVVRRLTIQRNKMIAQVGNGTTGIQVMGGWGCQGLASGNRVEDVAISDNLVKGNDVAIWLIGGRGPSARNNRVMRILPQNNIFEDNTESIRITDNEEGAVDNTVEISAPIPNAPPIARAGRDQIVATGSDVILDGSDSYDPDRDRLTYSWTLLFKPERSEIAIADSGSKSISFTPDRDGQYKFQLIVRDDQAHSTPDYVTVRALGQDSKLIVATNKAQYRPGDTLELYLWVGNAANASEVKADAFIGFRFPNGSLYFFDPAFNIKSSNVSDPRTFTPFAENISLAKGWVFPGDNDLDVDTDGNGKPDSFKLLSMKIPSGFPSGNYFAFSVLAEPGSVQSGSPRIVGDIRISFFAYSP